MSWVLSALLSGCGGEQCKAAASFPDGDGDGYGDPDGAVFDCEPLAPGFVRDDQDCDDADPDRHPGVPEVCDGIDQDCDGINNEDPEPPRYEDLDDDGYGDPDRPQGCDAFSVADGTDCDDADPEVNPGTTWHEDLDGDTIGGTPAGSGCVAPAPGLVPRGGDCDDGDPDRFPGAHERCDGVDQDCVEAPEGPDAWAYEGLRVRLPVTVTAPARASTQPIAFDVDLAALVAEVGDPQLFDLTTLRAALHDCGGPAGEVPLPVQFLGGSTGALAPDGGDDDPLGDGVGSVLVLYDLDGDLATVEPMPAGATFELGLYLQGEPPPTAWVNSDLVAEDQRLAAGGLEATFDPDHGGLLDTLSLDGGPSVASQTGASVGNGLRTLAGGRSVQDYPGDVVVLDRSDLTAAVRSFGHVDVGGGGFDYSWTWRVFPHRPELWVEPWLHATGPMTASGVEDATEPIRPLQLSFADRVGATCTTDPGLGWADVSDGISGVTWAWAAEPLWVNYLACTATETWTSANDLAMGEANPTQATGGIATGLDFVDSPVLVLLPHAGGAGAVEDRREALREGPTVAPGAVQR